MGVWWTWKRGCVASQAFVFFAMSDEPLSMTRWMSVVAGTVASRVRRKPTAGHLVSWAKFAPIENSSAGMKKGGSTGKGNPWIGGTFGEIVLGASRTHTFLAERYRRLARRRGKKRAIVATGNTVLTIAYHLLSDPDARYSDLGPGFYDSKAGRERHARNLIRQLEHLTGKKVALNEAT